METWLVSMALEEPYSVAYESYEVAENVFVRIETEDGSAGCGCAAPDEHVTGETPGSVLEILQETAAPAIEGLDVDRPFLLLDELKKVLQDSPSALAAIDMAVYDILAKADGQPLWNLLGGRRERIKTSMTIGILPEKETVERACHWKGHGLSCLKIKGGKNVEADIVRVLKVRQAVGEGISLRFDANQGYTVAESIRFAKATESAALEFIEQPTPGNQPDLLGEVTRQVAVPVMADESLVTMEDALYLAKGNLVGLFNLKLMKVGGIAQASQIDGVAGTIGNIKTMVGCMDEAALAIAAGLAFALASPNVVYADLDGHIGLKGDPSEGAVLLRDGFLYPSPRPGLGVELLPG